jgi:hypothetical protein
MFRDLWVFHRRAVIATVIVVVLPAATAFVVLASRSSNRPPTSGPASASPRRASATDQTPTTVGPAEPTPRNTGFTPLRVVPPATQTQKQTDAQLAAAESPESIAQSETETVPAPKVSRVYPAVPGPDRTDPDAYALAFTRELLTIDYRTQTRTGLLAWAQSEEAPDTLPGVPPQIADKSLVGSLAYNGVTGTEVSPIASATHWPTPSSGTTQRVSGLAASVTPDWTQLISSGWEPTDPLMTVLTVTGSIIVSTPGHPGLSRSFSMAVTLGGARTHPGYGAVAVSAWTVA